MVLEELWSCAFGGGNIEVRGMRPHPIHSGNLPIKSGVQDSHQAEVPKYLLSLVKFSSFTVSYLLLKKDKQGPIKH